jgi:hypothetical protein
VINPCGIRSQASKSRLVSGVTFVLGEIDTRPEMYQLIITEHEVCLAYLCGGCHLSGQRVFEQCLSRSGRPGKSVLEGALGGPKCCTDKSSCVVERPDPRARSAACSPWDVCQGSHSCLASQLTASILRRVVYLARTSRNLSRQGSPHQLPSHESFW